MFSIIANLHKKCEVFPVFSTINNYFGALLGFGIPTAI